MNAITDLQGADLALEYIPLTSIRVSGTTVQTLRRAHYRPDKLLELAANIQANGVLQPILVKPIAIDLDVAVKYEIVAGERRYLAADRAGLAHIPCVIRDLDTIQTLQAQLVENIAREQLSALEEATGFKEMLDQGSLLNAEKVGERIGKSRAYVYARLKLLDLVPAARTALADGTLDASKALLLARIQGHKMQTRALKIITEQGAHYSTRRLFDTLRNDLTTPLADAPWLPGRDTLHAKSGDPTPACSSCPHNSANDPELQDDLGSDEPRCTDRGCFEIKAKLHAARLRDEWIAAGKTVVTGEGVADVLDTRAGWQRQDVHKGYVRLDSACDSVEFNEPEPKPKAGQSEEDFENSPEFQDYAAREMNFEPPSYASLIGELPDTILVQTSSGMVPVAPVASVAKALKAKGVKVPDELKAKRATQDDGDDEPPEDPVKAAAERAREEERRKVEEEYRKRLALAVHAKYKGNYIDDSR